MTQRFSPVLSRLRRRANRLKHELVALGLATRDPRVPWYARAVAFCVFAYAVSPIDLIPDPVPILGHLDDLILVPLGVAIAFRLIPSAVLADCRAKAEASPGVGRLSWVGATIVVVAWLLVAGLVLVYGARFVGG